MSGLRTQLADYDGHFAVRRIEDSAHGLDGYIAIHRKFAGVPSFGASRVWQYQNSDDMLREALRLSRLMTYKSALASLEHGGAKAVLLATDQSRKRPIDFFQAYARQVNNLQGIFITGSDVGVSDKGVAYMKAVSPYIVGVKVNPGFYTARGIYLAMRACLYFFDQTDNMIDLRVGIEGVGKVGAPLMQMLLSAGAKVIISDIDSARIGLVKKAYPQVEVALPAELWRKQLDIYSPCALSDSVRPERIGKFRCRMIIGPANNQLASEEMGDRLYQSGIYYAPDYLVNSGGLISVVKEYDSHTNFKKEIEQGLQRMVATLLKINKVSQVEKKPPHRIANQLAEQIVNQRILEKSLYEITTSKKIT